MCASCNDGLLQCVMLLELFQLLPALSFLFVLAPGSWKMTSKTERC